MNCLSERLDLHDLTMDKLSAEQRHKCMAAIHGKDTKPEMVVRRYLWSRGFRYRLNHPRLPGKPDLVLRKYRTCIFVNGCFWHGHRVDFLGEPSASRVPFDDLADEPSTERVQLTIENSECCKIPRTNRAFWVQKIRRNQERDREVQRRLAEMGWHAITVWECQLSPKQREQTLRSLVYTLNSIFLQDHAARRPYTLPEEEPLMAAEDIISR